MSKSDWQGCSKHKNVQEGCLDCWCPKGKKPEDQLDDGPETHLATLPTFARQAIMHYEANSPLLKDAMAALKRELEKCEPSN